MLIASLVLGWIGLSVAGAVWAMRNAAEPPLVECFDCRRDHCAGCPFLEKARLQEQEDDVLPVFEEKRLAA